MFKAFRKKHHINSSPEPIHFNAHHHLYSFIECSDGIEVRYDGVATVEELLEFDLQSRVGKLSFSFELEPKS
jgi:hypothetical protein